MEPIGSIGAGAGQLNPAQTTGSKQTSSSGQAAVMGSSATMSSQTLSIHSSMTHIAQVSSRVDSFLGSLGADLQNNELLRMIIGLLILELLLGDKGDSGSKAAETLGALANFSTGRQTSQMLLMESSQSSIQVDYAAVEATSTSATQSTSETHTQDQQGGNIDLTA